MKIESNLFRNYSAESALFIRRTIMAFIGILLLTFVLITNLYHLQIVRFENYRIRSNENRIKLIPITPSRGIIYDCNGIPLALNRTIYQLKIMPEKIDNLKEIIDDLKSIVDLTNDDITNFKKERKCSCRFTSLPLKVGLTDVQQARFAINQYRFPSVELKSYLHRYYPYGSALTHVIGYVSKINSHDTEQLNKKGILPNYTVTHDIGKLGIERYYENILRGKIGYEQVEINNRGQIVRQLQEQSPQAGKAITLTLDVNLQQYIEKLLAGRRAAVVVADPRDGAIRALISSPSYDPNLFVKGMSNKEYYALLQDKDCPFINRVTQGIYPPASTVKPYISVSALTLGIINKNSLIFDPGWWQLPGLKKRYRDWKRWGHGMLNVTKALEESADTFFYQLSYDMGIDRLSEWMTKFGYGQHTGIDILEEHTGIMPTRNWKIKYFKKPWYQGDTIPVGIGQGYWSATPIQMLKSLMTLINNGKVKTPHLLYSVQENDQLIYYQQSKHIQIGDPHTGWDVVKDGMYGVANRYNGTARKNFANTPYRVAAKSGTAQVYSLKANEIYNAQKIAECRRDHKLMTAFAPFDKPTVSIVVILENSSIEPTVGTITRKILDYILLKDNITNLSA